MLNKKIYLAFVIAFVFLVSGCASGPDCQDDRLSIDEMPIENASFSFDYQEENFERVFPEYLISASDVLDVLFHIKTDFNDDDYQFKLENDNNIFIKFTHTPELNEEQYIRPDGTISLPLIGVIKAAGKTVTELKRDLRSKYAHVLQNPEIHILVPEFSKRIEELKKDLHTAPRGLSRLVTVRPDGYVTFPMVGEMEVRGRTITEINQQLNEGYISIFRGLQVDLFLHKSAGSNVYVLGNVTKVGAYEITRPITILEALTLAEGVLPSTQLEGIIVLRRNDELKKLVATQVNVEDILNLECGSKAFFLKPYDIVYVPKTGLAEAAEIGRDLKDTMMFRGWGINLSPVGDVLDFGNQN
ncbi:MAG: sugar transporter [Methylococcaceae bacterium]|nr:sugar transporter [Methylococcaceae bacterium]